MSKHTPGPWRWEVNLKHRKVELCGGKPEFDKTVMSFARWGMNSAAPEFVHDDGDYPKLTRCDELTQFVAGREHHKDWFQTIDNAYARLIASAPTMLEALERISMALLPDRPDGSIFLPSVQRAAQTARAAIAKAKGETP